ncbi:hypothetical protein AAT19DRAFT_8532 [Rhodotorula toruloides]|uniref:Proteophosphoglycan ppg4 n=1 Tax=Rhodotorula toruloides TaxID=5286 RepID=A0A2T0AHK4_RHOTO|nr:hypothetical protein AAT19DRAFT_8532 [Rhodotorula toruloides]
MCRAVTCLSYCIAVTTKSLLFAAEAYPTLEPTLRFLDLVSLRVRRGTLRVSSTAAASAPAISRLLLELWDLVRDELVEVELFWAEQRIARGLLCSNCQGTVPPNVAVRWTFPQTAAACAACCDVQANFDGISDSESHKQSLRRLFKPFRLCLPTPLPIRPPTDPEENTSLEADSRTATSIAIAPSWTEGASNALSFGCDAGNYDEPDEQSVVDVYFRVPRSAKQRLKAVVRRYHLQPVQISDGILAHKHTKKVEALLDVRDKLVGYLTHPCNPILRLSSVFPGGLRSLDVPPRLRASESSTLSRYKCHSVESCLRRGSRSLPTPRPLAAGRLFSPSAHRVLSLRSTRLPCSSRPLKTALDCLPRRSRTLTRPRRRPLVFISSRASFFCSPDPHAQMCRATTQIFFGLPIRTWSLVPAADAWPKLVKTLHFFDLIMLRILSGTLLAVRKENPGPSAVERVPIEVWDVVKHKLVDLELQDANDRFMRDIEVNEWSCWGSGLRKPGKALAGSALPPFWTDICIEAEPCDMCSEAIFELLMESIWPGKAEEVRVEDAALRKMLTAIDGPQKLQTLLKAFGLYAPFPQAVLRADKNWFDLSSATYIALPPSPDEVTSLEADCGGDMFPDQHAFRHVDPEIMAKLARDGRDRFRKIIRDLHLESLSIKALPSEPDSPRVPPRSYQYCYFRREFTEITPTEANPAWTMHTTCETTCSVFAMQHNSTKRFLHFPDAKTSFRYNLRVFKAFISRILRLHESSEGAARVV